MKLRYLFLAAVLFAGACSRPSETFSTGIIPVPQHVNWGEGTFRMPRTLTYVTDLEGQEKADLAAWMERSVAGRFFPVPFVEALEGDIPALRLRIADKGAPESYRLDVVRDSMTITAPDAAGLFYGLQSLAQLAENCKRWGLEEEMSKLYGATYSRRYDRRRSAFRLPGLHARRIASFPG